MESTLYKQFLPIEVTTHNLYFHEEASIFTIDTNGELIATGGDDYVIRLWSIEKLQSKEEDLSYSTGINTTVKIKYKKSLVKHTKAVSCVRFRGDLKASASDGGNVLVWMDDKAIVVRRKDDNDACSLVWGDNKLFVGLSDGMICGYDISTISDPKILYQIRAHRDIVQGLAWNSKYSILTTASNDRSSKTFLVTSKLEKIDKIEYLEGERVFSRGKNLFRRLEFSEDNKFLFLVSCVANQVIVLHYPFRIEHIYAKIGPLSSEVVKVLQKEGRIYIITRKSVYLYYEEKLVLCVDNMCFRAITDGCIIGNLLIVSSLDGFLASLSTS